MVDTALHYPLEINGKTYYFELIAYGQKHLYPGSAGFYIVANLGAVEPILSLIYQHAYFGDDLSVEKLHHELVESHNPTHLLYHPKHASESILELFNQCSESYPPLVTTEQIDAFTALTAEGYPTHSSHPYTPLSGQSVATRCGVCSGSGKVICSSCGGVGGRQVMNPHIDFDGNPVYEPQWENCYACSGGFVNCSACSGIGER